MRCDGVYNYDNSHVIMIKKFEGIITSIVGYMLCFSLFSAYFSACMCILKKGNHDFDLVVWMSCDEYINIIYLKVFKHAASWQWSKGPRTFD